MGVQNNGDVGFVFSCIYIFLYVCLASSFILYGLDTTTSALCQVMTSITRAILVRNALFGQVNRRIIK